MVKYIKKKKQKTQSKIQTIIYYSQFLIIQDSIVLSNGLIKLNITLNKISLKTLIN